MKMANDYKTDYNYDLLKDFLLYKNNHISYIHTIHQFLVQLIDIDNTVFIMLDNNQRITNHTDKQKSFINDNFIREYQKMVDSSFKYEEIIVMIENYFSNKYECCVYPIIINGLSIGYILFSHSKIHKTWNSSHKDILYNASIMWRDLLLHKMKYNDNYFDESVFYNMINKINTHIYVSDPKTDRILYMNEKMKKDFHIENPIGKICWKVLQKNQKERCGNCPIDFLSDHSCEDYVWEDMNSINHRIYQNHDSLIQWFNHDIVHFQHSHDITDIKRIAFDAAYDELTGILNRKAGHVTLSNQLYNAKKEEHCVQVCLFDIDNLKLTNDVYGHIEGDHMIKVIAETVKKNLKEEDVFFRISGDEFIVSFYNQTGNESYDYMMNVLKELKKIEIKQKVTYQLSFCFGISEVLPTNHLSLSDIINSADEKMYIWKKRRHLRIAQQQLRDERYSTLEFDYDKDLLYDALAKSTDDYIFICNMKTGTFRYTPEMVKEFNFPSEVIQNAAAIFGSKIHRDDKYEFLNSNQQVVDGKTDNHIVEYRALNKDNEWVWLRCRGQVGYDSKGEASIFAGFITNLGKKNSRDILTSLYNKFEFQKRINDMEGSFSIFILNIDEFKNINSLYDREFGDNVLRIIAQNIQTILHNDGILFKLDGDEFGFITKQTNFESLNLIFDKIQSFVAQKHSYEGKPYIFTISCGVAISPKNGNTYLELQRNAELALQYAKRNKKGSMIIVNSKIRKEKTRILQLTNALKQDINNNFNNFYLVYQPIINTSHQHIVKVEALCRWKNNDFPHTSPAEFIPLLEETGDIIKLGRFVFRESIKQLKEWLDINPQMSISINVSHLELIENNFVSDIQEIIDQYDVAYQQIVIELTETAIAKNTNLVLKNIKELRKLGIKIAMDDFGTGYSSLASLKNEPLDIIKIDQTFVRGIEHDNFNLAFVKLMIELCHQINLLVLIEGIETKNEYDTLMKLSPDFIQGYYTGYPMENKDLVILMKKQD